MSVGVSDGNGGLYIRRSVVEKAAWSLLLVVGGGLAVSAIAGNVVMYRQQGETRIQMDQLTASNAALAKAVEKLADIQRLDTAKWQLGQDQIKQRLAAIDKKVE